MGEKDIVICAICRENAPTRIVKMEVEPWKLGMRDSYRIIGRLGLCMTCDDGSDDLDERLEAALIEVIQEEQKEKEEAPA